MRTFSSSSFFSERCLRLRAVSSRLSAISASFSGFFLREVSSTPIINQWAPRHGTRRAVNRERT